MKATYLRTAGVLLLLMALVSVLPAQTVIQVAAGVDSLTAAFAAAPAGSIIELTTSGGDYIQSADLTINKDITFRAKAGLAAKPIIYCAGSNTFYQTNGGLNVYGIKFDGDLHGNAMANYFISMKADTILTSTKFSLRIDNCEFRHCAQRCVYTSDGTMHPLDSLLMTNSVFVDNTKQILYEKGTRNALGGIGGLQPGGAKYIKLENLLIVGTTSSSDGYATYIEPANRDSASYTYPTVIVNHVTVDSMRIGGISTYTTPNATVKNCIVINMQDTSKYPYQVETGRFAGAPRSHVLNCMYNNAPYRFVSYGSSSSAGYAYPDTANIINATPLFTNNAPAVLDYSLTAGSAGKGKATDGKDLGYIAAGLGTAVLPVSGPVPQSFQLSQNFPNPFNPTTTIKFSVVKSGKYSVNVYNLLGQQVASVFTQTVSPGSYEVVFDASHLTSGMYVYTLTGDNVKISKKLVLLK